MKRWSKQALLPLLLGALTVLGFAPFHLYWLPPLTLAALFHLWSDSDSKSAAWSGFCFGLGLFLFGVSWVYVSLHNFGGMPAPVTLLATLLFCSFLALYPALAGLLQSRLKGGLSAAFAAPACWALGEWLRGWIFTGFPWLSLGYSQVPSPLAGFAPLVGVYGVSLVVAISSALLLLLKRQGATRYGALLALLAIWGSGFALSRHEWTHPVGAPVSVSLLQGNIPQDLKWEQSQVDSTLDVYRKLVEASRSRLIILPETALPLLKDEVPSGYLELLSRHALSNGGDILLGIAERSPTQEYYNSVFDLGSFPPESYRKSHLVPFGEFLPVKPLFGWILDILHIPMADFSSGSLDQRPMRAAGQLLAIDICYEDVFGEEVIRQLPEATALVNVSNDAWFGDSIAPRQHLQISQMRALETGRMMLRSTNTGMTAIVDSHGKLLAELPAFKRGSLDGLLQGYQGATPYVRFGNGLFLLLLFMILAPSLVAALRKGVLPASENK